MKSLVANLSLTALNALVEFRTSIAIITSVLIGTSYATYREFTLKTDLLLAMLIASIFLDGAATVFNHYFDFKKARTKKGYSYNIHNPIVAHKLAPQMAYLIGMLLVVIASTLGLYLVFRTHWLLIPLGTLAVLISYLYSGGGKPISYTPYSEIISGLFEGSLVIIIAYFVQTSSISWPALLISLPTSIGIANIMLANNISDLDEDKKNGRRTLPIVLGQSRAVNLLYFNHLLMYMLATVFVLIDKLPLTTLLIYASIPLIINNLRFFDKSRNKAYGFAFILRNTIIFNIGQLFTLWLAIILSR